MVFPLRKEKALRKEVEVTAETKAQSLPKKGTKKDACKDGLWLLSNALTCLTLLNLLKKKEEEFQEAMMKKIVKAKKAKKKTKQATKAMKKKKN